MSSNCIRSLKYLPGTFILFYNNLNDRNITEKLYLFHLLLSSTVLSFFYSLLSRMYSLEACLDQVNDLLDLLHVKNSLFEQQTLCVIHNLGVSRF